MNSWGRAREVERPMLYLGIDPGIGGGIAVLAGRTVRAHKMPETVGDLLALLKGLVLDAEGYRWPAHALLERAHPMPKQGVVSVFTYGRGYGRLEAALQAAAIPYDEVTAPVWQQAMGCRSRGDKRITKARAQQLFPQMTITHAIADALLIAEFCRRTRGSHGEVKKEGRPRRQVAAALGTSHAGDP